VQSIRWIELLDAVQAFKQPPKVIHLDNSVIFPFWTKSAALARIAKNEPSAVAKVVSRMPRTTNPRVNDHLMNVASLVPTIADVQRVLPHAIHYAKQRYYLSASAFSDVIQRWVSVGAIEAALRLTKEIIQFKRGYRPKLPNARKGSRQLLRYISREPEPRVPIWEFKQILDGAIARLGEAEPQKLTPI
jgi:hypothetical protein